MKIANRSNRLHRHRRLPGGAASERNSRVRPRHVKRGSDVMCATSTRSEVILNRAPTNAFRMVLKLRREPW